MKCIVWQCSEVICRPNYISPITGSKKEILPDNVRAYYLALDSVFPEIILMEPSFLTNIFRVKDKKQKGGVKSPLFTGLIGPKHVNL